MKKWEKPRLIVLVRSNPQESLIAACKHETVSADPSGAYGYCIDYAAAVCEQQCDTLASS